MFNEHPEIKTAAQLSQDDWVGHLSMISGRAAFETRGIELVYDEYFPFEITDEVLSISV